MRARGVVKYIDLALLSILNPTPRPSFRKKSEKKIIKVYNFYENL